MAAIKNADDKNDLLDKLSVCLNRAFRAKLTCEAQGRNEDAAKFDKRISRLQLEIDLLIEDLLKDWTGSASKLKDSLDAANAGLRNAIADIEQSVKTAQNIVKAIGYIDDVLAIAADLIP